MSTFRLARSTLCTFCCLITEVILVRCSVEIFAAPAAAPWPVVLCCVVLELEVDWLELVPVWLCALFCVGDVADGDCAWLPLLASGVFCASLPLLAPGVFCASLP